MRARCPSRRWRERLEFNEQSIPVIAQTLDVVMSEAPYSIHGATVYEASLFNQPLGRHVQVVFWPSIRRIDAYVGDCQIIFKQITEVQILPGIEVIFRRPPTPGQLLITRAGRVAVAT
jgi:hypothetical protein